LNFEPLLPHKSIFDQDRIQPDGSYIVNPGDYDFEMRRYPDGRLVVEHGLFVNPWERWEIPLDQAIANVWYCSFCPFVMQILAKEEKVEIMRSQYR